MNIAIITPFNSFSGGVESVNQILINLFKEEGHTINLVTSENYSVTGFEKILCKVIGLPYITAKKFKPISKEFDLVIANGEFGWKIQHPLTINLFHGCFKGYRDLLKKMWPKKTLIKLAIGIYIQKKSARNKYVVAVSDFIKEILENDGIFVNRVIPNCVDTNKFYPQNIIKKGNYLFVGSFNYYAKGFDLLEKIAEEGYKIFCITNQLPSSKLLWLKNVDNDNMPIIYNQYKILLLPSRFEGMSMVVLEAMSCGIPVITSNVGIGPNLKKIIPEFVVESYNYKEYIARIKLIEKNYTFYSSEAIKFINNFHSFKVYKKSWLNLVEELIK